MKKILSLFLLFSFSASATCFLDSEESSAGLEMICYYDCLSGKRAVNLDSGFCPYTLDEKDIPVYRKY